ncbi:MAG: ABC transporter permease [Clostridiales bacterium]|nr:ABC transporter permease [Clostridiales bacterium]
MGIIFKHTLKNIFKKPLRTFLVVLCVFACSFIALFSLDMSGALDNLFRSVYSQDGLGKTDVIVSSTVGDMSFLEDEGLPEFTHTEAYEIDDAIYTDIENEYSYVLKNEISIMGFDFDEAKEMGMFSYDKISDYEVLVSEKFAEKYGYKKGDKITLNDEFHNPVEFTISDVKKDTYPLSERSVLITKDAIRSMMIDPKPIESYLNLKDESLSQDMVDKIKDAHPTVSVVSLMDDPQLQFMINVITKLTMVLFAISILMVIFVTISVSERIISERMAVVGTLRSVGVSSKTTAMILLFENALYGLIGAIPACFLYSLVRNALLMAYIGPSSDNDIDFTFGSMKFYLYIVVIIAAILIECLCPLKEIIKASSTPIRDLIFMNKDTEYRFSKAGTIGGILCIVIAVILFFVPKSFYISLAQVFLFAFALSLLFPYIQYAIGKLLYRLFNKTNMPIAKLAATEVFTKKSTFGSSVLITTSIALAIIIYSVSLSLLAVLASDRYDSTNQIITNGKEASYYRFVENLDGVSDVQYFYAYSDDISVNGKTHDMSLAAVAQEEDGTFGHFTAIRECGPLEDDEISFTDVLAKKFNVKVGDQVEVVFHNESYYPMTRTMTVRYICDTSKLDVGGMTFILSNKTFHELYPDEPRYILFNSETPDKTVEFIDKYAGNYVDENTTREKALEDSKTSSAALLTIIYFAIGFGVGITFLGAVSNLLIGFEGRKRECAVLMSTSLPRKKLNKLFLLESFFSSGIALLGAIPAGIILYKPIQDTFAFFSFNLKITSGIGSIAGMLLILWGVFTLTSLFVMRAVRKMKLAEQLKYE